MNEKKKIILEIINEIENQIIKIKNMLNKNFIYEPINILIDLKVLIKENLERLL
jgi:hypothetical protein